MDGSKEKQVQFESQKYEHQFIIEDQNHCCLCGSKLTFHHKIDYMTLKVQEDADCPSCKIRMKTKDHGLQ